MGRFKTKPFEVEAIQVTGENDDELVEFTKGRYNVLEDDEKTDDPDWHAQVLDSLHSTWVGVYLTNWIIKGSKGEFYPCDDEVFQSKYEEIEEESEQPKQSFGRMGGAAEHSGRGVITSTSTINRRT